MRFTRPHTLRLASAPKYARVSVAKGKGMDKFAIIKSPLFTDSSMKKLEKANTLTFLVDPRANKNQIKKALKDLHDITVVSVNTLIRYVPRHLRTLACAVRQRPRLALLCSCLFSEHLHSQPLFFPLVLFSVLCFLLFSPDGKKKAFCRLGADVEASDVASRVGFL